MFLKAVLLFFNRKRAVCGFNHSSLERDRNLDVDLEFRSAFLTGHHQGHRQEERQKWDQQSFIEDELSVHTFSLMTFNILTTPHGEAVLLFISDFPVSKMVTV